MDNPFINYQPLTKFEPTTSSNPEEGGYYRATSQFAAETRLKKPQVIKISPDTTTILRLSFPPKTNKQLKKKKSILFDKYDRTRPSYDNEAKIQGCRELQASPGIF